MSLIDSAYEQAAAQRQAWRRQDRIAAHLAAIKKKAAENEEKETHG